jgi:hypothetical protein
VTKAAGGKLHSIANLKTATIGADQIGSRILDRIKDTVEFSVGKVAKHDGRIHFFDTEHESPLGG